MIRAYRCALVLLCLLASVGAQSRKRPASASSSSTASILASAWNAFSGGLPVHSLQLGGSVSRQWGSTLDTGNVSATVAADMTSSVQLSVGRGTWSETRTATSGMFTCAWAGPDRVQHAIAGQNCWQTVPWYAPSLSVQSSLIPSNTGIVYVGHETLGTEGVEHLQLQVIYGTAQTPAVVTSLVQQVSTADLYLDSATFLPVLLRYSLRADQNANNAIPVEVHYSNFALLSGVTIPKHVEKYVEGSLETTVDISGVTAQ